MDVREKLVKQAISHFWYGVSHDIFSEPVTTYAKLAIEALKKENDATVQEWISVKDQLPESGKDAVLIALRWGAVDIGWCQEGRWGSEFVNEYDDGEVTHWMPLPQPPKGE